MDISTTDQYGKAYDIMLYWNITKTCNFNCPQCAGQALKLMGDDAPEVVDIEGLRNFLQKTDKTIRFSFTGGEPFLVKNIIEVLEEITKKHYFSIVTNLVSSRVEQFVERIDPGRSTFIAASGHMHELKRRNLLEAFFGNATRVKERGFALYTTEVAYPFILDKVEEYKKLFGERGFDLDFMAFRGEWKGKKYPDSYTREEIEIFGLENKDSLRPDIFNNKGKPCIAGYNSAVIMNDGTIFPCFMIFKPIGNIAQEMRLSGRLMRCPVDFCGCPVNTFEPYLYEKAMAEAKTNKIRIMIQKIRQNPVAVFFALILLLALTLRLIEIGKYSLWLDECISVFFANKSLHESLISKFDVQTLLFNISLCIWVKLFGISAIAVRSFSLIFGMLSVVLVYLVADKLFKNKLISLTAMLLFAVNPMCIHYSCEARAYSLLCFGTLFSFYCLLNFLNTGSTKNLILYIISAIILLYTHSFGWIFFFIESIYAFILIIKKKEKTFLKKWILSLLVIFVSSTYIIYLVIKGFGSITTLTGWVKKPDSGIFLKTIYELTGSDWLAMALFVLAIIYIVTLRFRKSTNTEYPVSAILFLATWIFLPLILIYFYSVFVHPLFVTRYFIICIPPVVLLTSFIINDLTQNKIFRNSAITVIALLLLIRINLNPDLSKTYNEPWEKICQDIKSHKGDKEIIIIEPFYNAIPFFYYYSPDYFRSTKDIFSQTTKFDTYCVTNQKDFENAAKAIAENYVWFIVNGYETINTENYMYKYLKDNKKVVYEWHYPDKYSLNVFYFK